MNSHLRTCIFMNRKPFFEDLDIVSDLKKQKLLQKVGVKFMCTTRNSKWKFNYLMFLTYIEHTYLYLV